MKLDARVPVVFGGLADAGAADALLIEGDGTAQPGRAWFQASLVPHAAGCACCARGRAERSEAGRALGGLMLARGRGEGVFFSRVVAVARTPAARREIEEALSADPVACCLCRLG